ncbi:uncharacterized protein LOC18438878 isoform X2 [Amborella trichopoda]|uniref:uncharacterized protein LOC18438878 isoform X2 n=1 Tax=Amborella trichopoda TaxID=13333 RepID=UPI0005D33171|nr:uncharacterized protein LOC18438878 isoform X2 [Amborella trichopoda]|eukprot:XP_011625121.1 uncharacterized protein LOC18438878 isoform X2 [Amborella trichopoda]
MDPASAHAPSSIEDDEWDADGFVIPSLGLGQKDLSEPDEPTANDSKPSSPKGTCQEAPTLSHLDFFFDKQRREDILGSTRCSSLSH